MRQGYSHFWVLLYVCVPENFHQLKCRKLEDTAYLVYSHLLNPYRLYGIHMKNTKRESVFRHRSCCPVTLLSPVGNCGCDNPRDRDFHECTEMTLLSWMSLPLPEGRRYVPRNPTGAKWSFCATSGEYDVTFSSFPGILVVMLQLWGSISLKLLSRRRRPAAVPSV